MSFTQFPTQARRTLRNLAYFCFGGILMALAAGCSTPAPRYTSLDTAIVTNASLTSQGNPNLLRPADIPFTLGPGDTIQIEILGIPNSRASTVVGLDGKIYYNLVPGLDVWGLTLAQTQALIERELAKYIATPQIALTLRTVGSKYVWVLGRLNRPGIYPMPGPMSLLETLALAGGPAHSSSQVTTEEIADLRHSFVMRQGQMLPVDFHRLLREGDTSQNIMLQPDDFVYVPSALDQEVYVLGAVKTPRIVPYTEQMSLVSALAGGSGPARLNWFTGQDGGPFMPDAYWSHLAIVRGSLAQSQMMVVDFNAIVSGKAPDVALEPGDIIYVPYSPYTTLTRYFNLILNTFVTTVAANEGIRAAGGTIGNVGVSVPVGGSASAKP
jgi:protein involved in polysaccharide export with SLBB domain